MVVGVEALGGLDDHVGQAGQHRLVEGLGDRGVQIAVDLTEGEGELGGIEHLDGQPAADLHLTGVVCRIGAQARGGGPVAHRVGAVLHDDVLGRLRVALGLGHLLAVRVEDPAADRRVLPRDRVVLEVGANHRREEPGANDVLALGTHVHRKDLVKQLGVTQLDVSAPAGRDLRAERGRRPGVHHVGIADEPAGLASLGILVARGDIGERIHRELFGAWHDRVVVVGLTIGIKGVPERDRATEEPLTADQPVTVEAADPVLVACAHELWVEVDLLAALDERSPELVIPTAVADVPLARGHDLERFVALLEVVGLALGRDRVAFQVARDAQGVDDRGAGGEGRPAGALGEQGSP